jgi:hypothetical protein
LIKFNIHSILKNETLVSLKNSIKTKPGVVAHICNTSSQEAKAGDHEFKASLGYNSRTLSKKKKKKKEYYKIQQHPPYLIMKC